MKRPYGTTSLVGVAAAAAVLTSCSSGSTGTAASAPAPAQGSSAAFDPAHSGGILHLIASSAAGTLDPQVNYTGQYWQLYATTYDGLLAFDKTTGPASFTIVPDLATALPTISDKGKTYTFTLRKGIRFSNGQPVTVADVAASFTRLFKVSNPNAGTWYSVIEGATACLKTPATCTLAGGVVTDPATNQVTFHLTTADAEFEDQLAVPFGSILPANAPAHDAGNTIIPGTGAYMFSSYNPNSALTLSRNPYFHLWSTAAQPRGYPNTITQTFGLTVENEVTAIENGQADWMVDPPPPDRLTQLSTTYASQVHVNPLTADWYLAMNTRMAPFNNLLARQAVNWAVNRAAAVKLYGGSLLATPTCTILPPAFPGHVNFCDYTAGGGTRWTAPDMTKARKLVQQSGTAGMHVALVAQNDSVDYSIGQYVVSVLNQMGYVATLKPLSPNIQFTYIQNTNNHVQISLSQWYQDYPAASDFLRVLLSCSAFHPGSDSSINIAGFCDPALDAEMNRAETMETTNITAANLLWGRIDEAVMKQAPWAPLFNPKLIDFVSKRVHNYKFSHQIGMLLDQVWVQ